MSQILTIKELAKFLKMHEVTVIKYAEAGQIPGWKIGSKWRFDKDVIDKMFRPKSNPLPAPRYDEVFEKGVSWLDKLGKED